MGGEDSSAPPLVSVLACLSAAAPAVKELLVARLDSPLEDIRVKVGNFQSSMPPLVNLLACLPATVEQLVSVLAPLSAAPAVKKLMVTCLDTPLEGILVKEGNFSASFRRW